MVDYNSIGNDTITLVAIGAITYLGYIDVTNALIIGAVAGLGGYRILKDRQGGDA